MSKNAATKHTRSIFRISVTAMFIAMTAICQRFFSLPPIYLFGEAGLTIGLSGIFTAFPAFLFGPIYGGITSACSDIIGYFIAPTGPYMPWFTITAFMGGFIKGLLWMLLRRRNFSKSGVSIILACLVLIGSFGVASHISLAKDNVSSGFLISKEELPYRGTLEQVELSPLSELSVKLATYNKDVLSVKVAEDAQTITIPANLITDGYTNTLTRIRANAFANCPSLVSLFIPKSITKLEKNAFAGLPEGCMIYTPTGSKTAEFCEENNIPYTESNVENISVEVAYTDLKSGALSFDNSDTFRKYLTGYINVMTAGMELVCLFGLGLMVLEWCLARRRKDDKRKRSAGFLRIFLAITVSGLLITTLNTWILLKLYYAGRMFWLLWVPRFLEELVVCMIQAYLISLLYNVFEQQIKPRLQYFNEE